MSVLVRSAVEDDIGAIYEISCSAHLMPFYRKLIPAQYYERFIERYSPSAARLARFSKKYITRFDNPTWKIWVAEQDGHVAGFTVTQQLDGIVELKELFVAAEYQGMGIGRQLLATSMTAVEPSQKLVLKVLKQNSYAIGLYEQAGFQKGTASGTFYGARLIQMSKH